MTATQPVPPENVRLRLRDQREIQIDCVYLGCWDDIHVWEAVRPPQVAADQVDALRIGMLPARTQVVVAS